MRHVIADESSSAVLSPTQLSLRDERSTDRDALSLMAAAVGGEHSFGFLLSFLSEGFGWQFNLVLVLQQMKSKEF
jgi:hypothetical protein